MELSTQSIADSGIDIHLFRDQDFAVLVSDSKPYQAYLPISYADIPVGKKSGLQDTHLLKSCPTKMVM